MKYNVLYKKNFFFFSLLLVILCTSCGKDDFFDRFPPEIMFYQYDQVETADFNQISLEAGQNEYVVKARVSAPNKLAQIKVYRDNEMVLVITEFNKDTEHWLSYPVTNISSKVTIRVEAIDRNDHSTVKDFLITKN